VLLDLALLLTDLDRAGAEAISIAVRSAPGTPIT